jgi:hypothetical protein
MGAASHFATVAGLMNITASASLGDRLLLRLLGQQRAWLRCASPAVGLGRRPGLQVPAHFLVALDERLPHRMSYFHEGGPQALDFKWLM